MRWLSQPMKNRVRAAARTLAGICLLAGTGALVPAQTSPGAGEPVQKGAVVTIRATGAFDVTLDAQTADEKTGGAAISRMSIDKQFHGDLEASSKGEMLTAGTTVKGSAGYVAIERVTGTLQGRSGTFVLQHSGTMTRGAPQLTITVVPDSGTAQLEGLAGKMTIQIADGKHSYDFEYTLPGR